MDHVDLIYSLYSWWEGFGSSSFVTLPLGFNCGFISTSARGSSTGVCSWGCPGGLGSAPVRARCGGGAAAWVTGVPAAPGTQGCWLLGQQEIQCSRRVWQPVLAHTLLYSCLENPPTEKPGRPVYRVAKSRTRLKRPCACRRKTYFCLWQLYPSEGECEGGASAWLARTLECQVCRDTLCLRPRSYGPIRVFFEPLVAGDQKVSLATLSL